LGESVRTRAEGGGLSKVDFPGEVAYLVSGIVVFLLASHSPNKVGHLAEFLVAQGGYLVFGVVDSDLAVPLESSVGRHLLIVARRVTVAVQVAMGPVALAILCRVTTCAGFLGPVFPGDLGRSAARGDIEADEVDLHPTININVLPDTYY
jgi:hypothetical protein